jgi:hypothetical protein
VRVNVRVGRPHEEIIAEADAELSELIIMARPEAFALEAVSRPGHGRARGSQRALPNAGVAANLENHAGTISASDAPRSDAQSSVAWQPNAVLIHA